MLHVHGKYLAVHADQFIRRVNFMWNPLLYNVHAPIANDMTQLSYSHKSDEKSYSCGTAYSDHPSTLLEGALT